MKIIKNVKLQGELVDIQVEGVLCASGDIYIDDGTEEDWGTLN